MDKAVRQETVPPMKVGWLPFWWVWILSRVALGWSGPDEKKFRGIVLLSLVGSLGLMALVGPSTGPTILLVYPAVVGANLIAFSDGRWRQFLRYRHARRKGGASRGEMAWAAVLLALLAGAIVGALVAGTARS